MTKDECEHPVDDCEQHCNDWECVSWCKLCGSFGRDGKWQVPENRPVVETAADYGLSPTLAAIRMALNTYKSAADEAEILTEIAETVRHAQKATAQPEAGDDPRRTWTLPKITDEMFQLFHLEPIMGGTDKQPTWTQAAADFICFMRSNAEKVAARPETPSKPVGCPVHGPCPVCNALAVLGDPRVGVMLAGPDKPAACATTNESLRERLLAEWFALPLGSDTGPFDEWVMREVERLRLYANSAPSAAGAECPESSVVQGPEDSEPATVGADLTVVSR